MSKYDKPVRLLFRDFVNSQNIVKGQIITRDQVISWFKSNYPKIQIGTITAHFLKMSVNAPSRVHYNVNQNGEDDLLYQIDGKHFRLYEKETDPSPLYVKTSSETSEVEHDGNSGEIETKAEVKHQPTGFVYQRNLSTNWLMRILGASAFTGIIAVIALVLQLVSSGSNDATLKTQQANLEIQLAQQQTQIALSQEQNRLQSEQLTVMAPLFNIIGQLPTPPPSDNNNFSLTATAVFLQATQIEVTVQAIAKKQKEIKSTQTAVAACPLPTRLQVGKEAVVAISQIRIREAPGYASNQVNVLRFNRRVDVIENPVCLDGIWWWQVFYDGQSIANFTGWAGEGDKTGYWLEPVP